MLILTLARGYYCPKTIWMYATAAFGENAPGAAGARLNGKGKQFRSTVLNFPLAQFRGAGHPNGSQGLEWLAAMGAHMMKHGVFEKKELGFGRITNSPKEAVELIVRSLPIDLRQLPKPQDSH